VFKTDDCMNNEHGSCKGFIKEMIVDSSSSSSSPVTKMCTCPCHDSMYQLVRNSIALVNQSQRNNPYEFTASGDDV
jgi:hypothetical protein